MPAPYNYLDKTGLTNLWTKIKEKFVVKELKTDSDSEYKVLSDNNLTDELKQKILDAGDSSFDGQYTSLVGKPSIEGHELASGNQTAASLGLATPSDISTATADMATQTWVTSQNYATTSNVNTLISQAVSTVYTPKGSLADISTLTTLVTSGKVGDVYNISSEFTTTADFVEGAGKVYPAGTNIVLVEVEEAKKWDVLAGSVDLSAYIKSSEMVAITSVEIDEICV